METNSDNEEGHFDGRGLKWKEWNETIMELN